MNSGTLIALIGLAVTLLGSFVTMLVYMYRVGSLVTQLSMSIAEVRKWADRVEQVPLLIQRLGAVEEIVRGVAARMHSDLPPMRERLDSVSEDVDELRGLKVGERLAVVEARTGSRAAMPATRPPRPGIKREDD